MRRYILLVLLLLSVVALSALFACPITAYADVDRAIIMNGATVSYGDFLRIDNVEATDGWIRCSFDGVDYSFDKNGSYCVRATEIWVYPDANGVQPSVRLCDDNGRVCLSAADYYFFKKNGDFYYIDYEHTWNVYIYEDKSTTQFYIDRLGVGQNNAKCVVQQRSITVAVDIEHSTTAGGDPLQVDTDGYLLHEYGSLKDNIALTVVEGSLYGSDVLDEEFDITGNDAVTSVGDYITDGNDISVIVRDQESQINDNYRVTVQDVKLRVKRKSIVVDLTEFGFDDISHIYSAEFTQFVPAAYLSLYPDATTQMRAVTVNSAQTLQIYYDVKREDQQPFDEGLLTVLNDLGNPYVVGINDESTAWSIELVGYTVDRDNENWTLEANALMAANYEVSLAADDYKLVVQPRPITIYVPWKDMDPAVVQDNWIDVQSFVDTSAVYGEVYDGEESAINIDYYGLSLTLTFEIAVPDKTDPEQFISIKDYIDTYLQDSEDKTLCLNVNAEGYSFINPKASDTHYEITVDPHFRWYVEPQPVTFASLGSNILTQGCYVSGAKTTEGKAFASYLAGADKDPAYCLGSFAYDLDTSVREASLSFLDAQGKQVDLAPAAVSDCNLPGYYAVTFAHANYAFQEDLFFIRIRPIVTSIEVPVDTVYDGDRHAASVLYYLHDTTLSGNENAQPVASLSDYDALKDWAIALTYNNNATAPSAAGTYTVKGSADVPSGYAAYNPYLSAPANRSFGISKAAVSVTVTSTSLSKSYGDSVAAGSFKYTSQGLVGISDRITLSCDAWAADARPGKYVIKATVNNPDNYTVSVVGSPTYTVNKLTGSEMKTYLDDFISSAYITLDTEGLHLPEITYYSLPLANVKYQYCRASANAISWSNIAGTTQRGLEEGITYRIRIIATEGVYLSTDAVVESRYIEITPSLSVPTLEQDKIATDCAALVLTITDYNPSYDYGAVLLVADDLNVSATKLSIGSAKVTFAALPQLISAVAAVVPTEEGVCVFDTAYRLVNNFGTLEVDQEAQALDAGATYYAFVIHKTEFSQVCNEPLAVYTRAEAPAIAKEDLSIEALSIGVPEGYACVVYEYQSDNQLPIASNATFAMKDLGYTYAALAESKGKIFNLSGEEVDELTPNRQYIVALWQEGENIDSDVLCMYFQTPATESNSYGYEGALAVIAQYLLLGLGGLNLILFIVCVARYAAIKRKCKNSIVGGRK